MYEQFTNITYNHKSSWYWKLKTLFSISKQGKMWWAIYGMAYSCRKRLPLFDNLKYHFFKILDRWKCYKQSTTVTYISIKNKLACFWAENIQTGKSLSRAIYERNIHRKKACVESSKYNMFNSIKSDKCCYINNSRVSFTVITKKWLVLKTWKNYFECI